MELIGLLIGRKYIWSSFEFRPVSNIYSAKTITIPKKVMRIILINY